MIDTDCKMHRVTECGAEHAASAVVARHYRGFRRAIAALSGCLLVATVWGVLATSFLMCPDGYASIDVTPHQAGAWRTERPLIGIVSQSLGPDALGSKPTRDGGLAGPRNSYIAASYVKFIESAGARVVPILQDMPREEVERRFKAVNGILIPGGSQILSPGHPYYDMTKILLDMTIDANDEGTSFPLHGTCLGFEALAVAVTGNYSILHDFEAGDDPRPLVPGSDMGSSDFFASMPRVLRNALFSQPFAYENHVHGITYGDFIDNPKLAGFFDMLTMSVDKRGKYYISTMEAKRYVDRDWAARALYVLSGALTPAPHSFILSPDTPCRRRNGIQKRTYSSGPPGCAFRTILPRCSSRRQLRMHLSTRRERMATRPRHARKRTIC